MDYINRIAENIASREAHNEHPNGSKLSTAASLDVLKVVRDELSRLGCRLVDYRIKFTTRGFDITDVKVKCNNPKLVQDALKEAEPEVRHEFSHYPTKYAFTAANVEIARRVQDELGLDYEALGYEDSDAINVSVAEPKEEKPLPPSEIPAPDNIAAGMGDEMTPIEGEPGLEDVEAATGGGGGGGGGGLGALGGGGGGGLGATPEGGPEGGLEGGPEGGLPGEEGEAGEGPEEGLPGEEGLEGAEEPGEGEEGAPEAGEEPEEEAEAGEEKPKKRRPGMEF